MDRVYTFLLSIGMSKPVLDWLLRRRLLILVLLGALAWLPVIVLIQLFAHVGG
ncbi:hypothetical protein [Devosia sp. XK-2]|uniref:hypothetical protein n=1 Tax=Devosia sp. XK-2 TaxID=3126689 RepID=UPI0030CEE658